MADVRRFKARPSPLPLPPRLTDDERQEWARMVEALRSVGMERRTTRRALRLYVRRFTRAENLHRECQALDRVEEKVRRLQRRLTGPDAVTAAAASRALREAWCEKQDECRRLRLAMLGFLRRHRLTPLSRLQENEP